MNLVKKTEERGEEDKGEEEKEEGGRETETRQVISNEHFVYYHMLPSWLEAGESIYKLQTELPVPLQSPLPRDLQLGETRECTLWVK